MADGTAIEWADATWNPIRGTQGRWHCVRTSPGCKGCYAAAFNRRLGGPDYVAGADMLRLDEDVLAQPLHWRKPRGVFPCSMTDLFLDLVPDEWIDAVWAVMALTPRHTYRITTKRADRMERYVAGLTVERLEAAAHRFFDVDAACHLANWINGWSHPKDAPPDGNPLNGTVRRWPLPNVWLGVSVEDRPRLRRIEALRRTPAAIRWVSFEPLLEDLGDVDLTGIAWAVFGGESGRSARPCDVAWVRRGVEGARRQGVAPFVKQLGRLPVVDFYSDEGIEIRDGWEDVRILDRKGREWGDRDGQPTPGNAFIELPTRDRKGGDPAEWSQDLRDVREFPRTGGRT